MMPPITHRLMKQNPNILNLEFYEPDWVENFILNEIEEDYRFDELGLDENSFVIDIGAHVGVVSIYLAKKYGCAVDCYEPTKRNFDKLCKNIRLNDVENFVYPYNLAVTKDGRDVDIGISEEWGSNDIYGIHTKDTQKARSISVNAILLNRSIDLLKIDCEIAEFEILENIELFKDVKAIRGEFHSQIPGDIDTLLAKVLTVVPNTRVTMLRTVEEKKQMRRAKRKLARLARKAK